MVDLIFFDNLVRQKQKSLESFSLNRSYMAAKMEMQIQNKVCIFKEILFLFHPPTKMPLTLIVIEICMS